MDNLTDEQLIEIYHGVFDSVHSRGFMIGEVKNLLFANDYWFLERPKDGWGSTLMSYLDNIGYNKELLKMNPILLK